ncbi:MAG: amidohydrolase family protein [Nitrospirae bacterium]|nr:amidohydrolase family protein [Nitrospirota bacterium]
MRLTLGIVIALSTAAGTWAQDVENLPFHEYDPPSTLVVAEHPLTRARYPFIDVHNHQFGMPDQDLSELTAEMDKLNMAVMVNLSGRGFRRVEQADGTTRYAPRDGGYLQRAVTNASTNAPGRFIVFTNIDVFGIDESDWGERTLRQLDADVANGANGLKIYKNLGLTAKDAEGERIPVNDPRLDPIWARCGELGIPVLIHTGEPAPFWRKKDGNNERLLELIEKPERYRDPEIYPSWEEVMEEQHDIFRKHPRTNFINAHLGWMGNDLESLGALMDELPNMYTEIGAVLAELGRQPRFAREWLIRYQDRVMFGKDSWRPEEYHVYFRVLETADDYFDYYRRRHAFWKMYGLDLPDDVLRKLYYKNALRVVPGIDSTLFPDG